LVVLGRFNLAGFGWFWLVPCFSNYGVSAYNLGRIVLWTLWVAQLS